MRAGGAIAPAAVVMVLGVWLSLETVSPPGFDAELHWPLLITAAGACYILGYLVGGGPWQIFLGLLATGSGIVMYGFSGGLLEWSLLPELWPVFLLLLGIAGLAYLVASHDAPWPLVVPALGTLLTGSTGLLYALGLVTLDPMGQLRLLWPALLVLTGLTGILQALWHAVSR